MLGNRGVEGRRSSVQSFRLQKLNRKIAYCCIRTCSLVLSASSAFSAFPLLMLLLASAAGASDADAAAAAAATALLTAGSSCSVIYFFLTILRKLYGGGCCTEPSEKYSVRI